MKTSRAGVEAIIQREGKRNHAYQDTRGVWTIGVGHTGPEVHRGLVWSDEEIDAALETDLARFEHAVDHAVHVPMTQNEFDACVSLAYNIGSAGFLHSSVCRYLNRGDKMAAADAFLFWNKPQELKRRRLSEREQFLTPDTGSGAHEGVKNV